MYRRSGAIPTIKREKFPSSFIVFDTEANRSGFTGGVETQTLRFGVARHVELDRDINLISDQWIDFTGVSELAGFLTWFSRKDRAVYVYAHNLKYDLQLSGLLTALIDDGWKPGLFVTDDPPTFIRLKRGRASIMMVDTFNYWQFSLAKMGDQLHLEKLPMPPENASSGEWLTYCKRDVEVLTEYLLSFMRFLKGNGLCGLGLTVASQAFRSFRARFMPCPIIIHLDENANRLERDGYTGGRVEAFYIGQLNHGRYFKLDVNSMYSFVMRDRSYPVELVSYSENVPVSRLRQLTRDYYCLADCQIDTLDPVYAYKGGVKLIFPVGSFRTVLHHRELVYALDHRHIEAVNRIALYKSSPIFTPYVDFFYNVKLKAEEENNPVLRHQAKIFLNSLYGKFGQREIKSEITENPGAPKYGRLTGYSESLGQRVEVNYLGDRVEVRYKGGESTYSFPAIAGGVTSNARLYLWELIQLAGRDHVYYVDTDSLIVSERGYERLTSKINPLELGMLKVEGEAEGLTVYGAKDYVFASEIKHKGVPKSARQLDQNTWIYEQFRGFKTWLGAGLPVGVEVYEREKVRRSDYDKGIVSETGSVSPWFLGYGG